MAKKSKKTSKKSAKKKTESHSESKNIHIEKSLIENFIGMQKVLTNLSSKFDNLTEQISKLLELFEITAKAMAEKDFESLQGSDNKEILSKMDKVLDQNKTIAKTLTLMNEDNFEKGYEQFKPSPSHSPQNSRFKPLPKY